MPGRNMSSSYRYNYQGQENAVNSKWEAFELRMHNPDLGRWMSPDPAGQFHSPYISMADNPISGVDPDGGYTNSGMTIMQQGMYNSLGAFNYSMIYWNEYNRQRVEYEGKYYSHTELFYLINHKLGQAYQDYLSRIWSAEDKMTKKPDIDPFGSPDYFRMNQYDLKQLRAANGVFGFKLNYTMDGAGSVVTTMEDSDGKTEILSSNIDLQGDYFGSINDYNNNTGTLKSIFFKNSRGEKIIITKSCRITSSGTIVLKDFKINQSAFLSAGDVEEGSYVAAVGWAGSFSVEGSVFFDPSKNVIGVTAMGYTAASLSGEVNFIGSANVNSGKWQYLSLVDYGSGMIKRNDAYQSIGIANFKINSNFFSNSATIGLNFNYSFISSDGTGAAQPLFINNQFPYLLKLW